MTPVYGTIHYDRALMCLCIFLCGMAQWQGSVLFPSIFVCFLLSRPSVGVCRIFGVSELCCK